MKKIIFILLGCGVCWAAGFAPCRAADTYTDNYNLRLVDLDVEDWVTPWGEKYNDNFELIDAALTTQAGSSSTITTGEITADTATVNTSMDAGIYYEQNICYGALYCVATCSVAGTYVIAGGCAEVGSTLYGIVQSYPYSTTSWLCWDDNASADKYVYAICGKFVIH